MIFAIVVAILAYRRANENGRSGIVWAIAGLAVFIGTQMIVTFGAGIFAGLGIAFLDWPEDLYDNSMYIGPVTVLALGASILASWMLLRYLDKPIDSAPVDMTPPPPPPPRFDSGA